MVQYDLFLSHASEDKPFAVWLYQRLRSKGYEVWLDSEAIPGSKKWKREIIEGVDNSQAFMILLSSHILGRSRKWVEFEYELASGKDKSIFPIRLPGVEVPDISRNQAFANVLEFQMVECHKYGEREQEDFLTRLMDALDRAAILPDESVLLTQLLSGKPLSDKSSYPGKPEHYGALLFSEAIEDVVEGIRALQDTGRSIVEDWIKSSSQSEDLSRSQRKALPVFVPILIVKLFDENQYIVSEALKAINSLGILPHIPSLLDTILSLPHTKDAFFADLLEQLVVSNYTGDDVDEAIVRLRQFGFDELIERLTFVEDDESV